MPINNRARQYFDYQLRDVPSYDNPYDSYVEKRKKLDEELDKLGVQDDLERDRIASEYLGRAPSTEAGYGTRFLDALASGGDQFQMNIGAMGEALGDKIGMAPLEIAGRNLAERNRQEMSYAPKFVDTPEEQSQKGFLRNLDDLSLQAVESLVGSSPAMLPPLAGAAIGGPLGVGIGIGGGLLGNAALEGGSTFSDYRNELIQRGYSERDAERLAREARDEVFSENLTDPELLTYGVAQGLVGPMAKGLGVLGTGAIQAGTGGLQEGRQYEVTETATGNPMEQFTGRFSTPEGRNAMAVGMVAEMPMVAAEYGVAKYQQRFDPRVDADATAVIQEAKGRAQQSVNESEAIRKQQILEREQFLKEQRAAENERRKAEKERLKQIQQQRIDEERLRQEQIKTDKAQLQALKDLSDDGQTDTKLPDDGSADFVEPMTADQIMLQEYEARQQAEQEATQEPTPEPAPPPAPVEQEVVAEPEPTPEPTPEPEPTFSNELDQLDQLEEEQQQQQPEPEPAVEEQVDPAELEAAAAAKEQEIRQRIIDEIKSRAELGDKQPKGLRIGSANRLQNPVRVLQQIAGDEVVETQLSLEQLRLLDQTLSSERRKEVVNEAIKEVLQRQPASSTDISQGVDLREPEIQESTMTPPEPAPAPMEQEQEAAPETPVLPAINDEGKTNNGRVTDDSAGAIPKTVFAPPESPTLVNRRDQPDLEPDAPLDENARPSGGSKEGEITNPLKVREQFEEIGYQDQKPVLNDGIDGLIQSRYSQALPNVFVFEGLTTWSAAHFNGGVGIAGRYESDSDKSRIGYLLAHEFGHASHSLLGDKINANSAVKNELKAIEEFLYPGLRQRVQEADTEGQNIDKQFFNYLLSAEELIAEINPYRLTNPEQVQKIAPTLSKLLASVEQNPDLVISRKVFPRGIFSSKTQAIGKLDENLKLKADRQVAGDQLYDQDNSAFEVGRLLKGNLNKDYGFLGDNVPFEVLQSAENQIELTAPKGKIELATVYSDYGYSKDRQKLEKASQLLDEAFQADPTKAELAFNKDLKEKIDERLAQLNQTESVVEDTESLPESLPAEVTSNLSAEFQAVVDLERQQEALGPEAEQAGVKWQALIDKRKSGQKLTKEEDAERSRLSALKVAFNKLDRQIDKAYKPYQAEVDRLEQEVGNAVEALPLADRQRFSGLFRTEVDRQAINPDDEVSQLRLAQQLIQQLREGGLATKEEIAAAAANADVETETVDTDALEEFSAIYDEDRGPSAEDLAALEAEGLSDTTETDTQSELARLIAEQESDIEQDRGAAALRDMGGNEVGFDEGSLYDPNAQDFNIRDEEYAPDGDPKELYLSYSSASRPTNTAGPSTKLTARQVKAAMEGVKSVLKKLDPNGDKVTVVANKNEAIAKLREMGRKRDADDLAKRGDNVMQEGFVIPGTGQIFLVADQIEGGNLRGAVDRMVEVTFHEALGHAGLRGLMGEKFDGFIKNFGIKNGKKIDAWLKTEDGSLYSSDPRDVQIEEYIARNFAEKGVQNVGFVEGLAQDVLQSLGMRKYSETALKQAMIKVQDSYVGSDGDIVDGTRGQVEEDEELRNVETVESPLVASFQRWFGDSKVLDKNGNPRVVYHGTGGGEIISFDPSKRGSFTKAASAKKGFFFAGNPKTARLYFDQNKITRNRTNGYYLKMENPLVYDQKSGPRKKLYNDIIKDAIRKGHDGVIIKNTFDGRREAGRGPQDDIFVVFDNKQIKRVDNKGTFNPDDERVKYSRRRRNIVGGEVPLSDWTLPTESKIKLDLIYKLQDKMVDTGQVVKAIKEARGDILDRWNPYLQEELYHGRTAKQTTDFLKKELQPLIEKLRDNNLSIAEFDEFLQNRHAQERNEQIAKINPALPDQGSGIKTADAQAYLNNLSPEQRQTFDDLARIVDDITAETRNILRNSSLESAATIENWENTYRYYVPLQREEFDFSPVQPGGGTGQGFDVRGPSSKGAVGSKRQVVDILANVALQRERAITRAQKNRVAQAVYGLAVQNPNPDFWLVIDPKNSRNPQLVAAQLQQMGIDPNVVENIAQKPLTSVRDKKTGLVHQRVNDALQNSDNYYSVRINGENKFVIFNANNPTSQRMVASIKNLDGQQLSEGMSHAAQITRYFASVNTQYNPIFGVVNLVRDTGGAAFNLSSTPLAGQQKAVIKGLPSALSGIYASLRGNTIGRNEYSDLFEEYQNEGAQTGYRDMFIRSNERAIALQKMLDPAGWADSKMGRFFTANGLLKAPMENVRQAGNKYLFDWLSDYNETMENAIRLSSYKVAKDQGMSNEQAASLAKNLTVNFNRKGQIATQAGALYAFFNATMQGNKRLVETLKGPAGKKIFAGGILLGVMQAALLEAMGYDEEEPPYFVRERNLIIPTGEKDYIQIPMPLGLHLLPNFGRVLTEYSIATAKSGKFQNPSKQIFELTGSFLDAFVPIGNAGFSTQTIVPTMGDPLAAIIENKDWSGRPIAQEDMSSTNPTPGYTRAKDTATWINTQIAKFLNYASGGTEFKKGQISPTPDQLDYLVGQAFGGVGRELLKGEQYIRSKFTGEELPPYKIPLGGRFYGNVGSSAAVSNQFFTNITRMNEHQAEYEGLMKSGRTREAQRYLQENPEANLYVLSGKYENSVRKLRKQRREMKERDLPRQQIETIENLIRSQMETLNNMVRKYK